MISFIYLTTLILGIIFLNVIFKKYNILLSHSGDKHQEYVEKDSIPLIGGIFLILTFLFLFLKIKIYTILFSMIVMFVLGIFSDLKVINSPKFRFLLQSFIIILFVYLTNLEILETRNEYLDIFLNNQIINFIFVNFCILILVNGSNFIDGLNGLLIGYFGLVSSVLFKIGFFEFYQVSDYFLFIYFSLFLTLFMFNIFNKLYLGDNGCYVISVFFGFMLINFHQNFNNISPYFIISLLWYPCFENLFSIIRKFRFNRSPIYPDSNHLHQLLFNFIKKKYNLKNIYNNNLSTIIILLFNSLIFLIALSDIYSTKLQLFSIILAVLTYICAYIFLFNFKFKNLKSL